MTTDAILTLTQWLSPAYPVGAFAYSHGLEALADTGQTKTAKDLQLWLEDVLQHGSGRNDAILLAAAWHATDSDALKRVNQTARAFAASRERLFETDQQGNAFGTITSTVWSADLSGLCYPVSLGHAASCQGLPLDLTLTMFLQAMLTNLVSAGQRLMPIGQTEAQTIIRDLTPMCRDIASDAQPGALSDLTSTAFISDIASMQHETQYSRIFRT